MGVAGVSALRRVLESQLYGISALDPRVFILAPLAQLAVAVLACFIPSLRATRVDPGELLRIE